MTSRKTIAILSDIHYASQAERERGDFCGRAITNPLLRLAVDLYRHHVWLRDPFAHNALVHRFASRVAGVDLVVANGDYSCDSGFVGVSDNPACQSARECLQILRDQFGPNFHASYGDHELGKKPMGADIGGLRLASLDRAEHDLGMPPFWQVELGGYVLMGVVSSLLALPIYEPETEPGELPQWRDRREAHLQVIRNAFRRLRPSQRVILFCHDPTALPFLWREPAVREKLPQIERTIIGHLHSQLILVKSKVLAGIPTIPFLGHTTRRLTAALREARLWRPFNVMLCPSLSGIELVKAGGFYTVDLDPSAQRPAAFHLHRLPRESQPCHS